MFGFVGLGIAMSTWAVADASEPNDAPAAREQACDEEAKSLKAAARTARFADAEQPARAMASAAWAELQGELEACTNRPQNDRGACVSAAEGWLAKVRMMPVEVTASVGPVTTACGPRRVFHPAKVWNVAAAEVEAAEALLARLRRSEDTQGAAAVLIPGGTFQMGSTSGIDNEQPVHLVTVSSFTLMAHEVTQALWQSVMGSNPSTKDYKGGLLLGATLPVQNVSWCDAVAFANALSKRDGLRPAYSGVEACASSASSSVVWDRTALGWRLPTEAEWEYAARGGSADTTWAGTNEEAALCRYGNVADAASKLLFPLATTACDDGVVGLAPVGSYASNGYGLYDMSGNIEEWTWDWFGPYEGGAVRDPSGARSGSFRMFRGGGWVSRPSLGRVAFRYWHAPDYRAEYLGVRLARSHS